MFTVHLVLVVVKQVERKEQVLGKQVQQSKVINRSIPKYMKNQ